MFYVSSRLPINNVKEHTTYTRLFELNGYQNQFLKKGKCKRVPAYKPPNLIPLNSQSTDHQIQILKKGKCKRSPHFRFLRCNVIILRRVCCNSLSFFLEYGKIYKYFQYWSSHLCPTAYNQSIKQNKKM